MLSPKEEDFSLPSSISPALMIPFEYVLFDTVDSLTFNPAFILSVPIGNLKNDAASSAVMIYGKR